MDIPLTIVDRLEAATSRLEDMVPAMSENSTLNGAPSISDSAWQVDSTNPSSVPKTPLPASIHDFDSLINGDVKTFVNRSEEIGGLVAEQV